MWGGSMRGERRKRGRTKVDRTSEWGEPSTVGMEGGSWVVLAGAWWFWNTLTSAGGSSPPAPQNRLKCRSRSKHAESAWNSSAVTGRRAPPAALPCAIRAAIASIAASTKPLTMAGKGRARMRWSVVSTVGAMRWLVVGRYGVGAMAAARCSGADASEVVWWWTCAVFAGRCVVCGEMARVG